MLPAENRLTKVRDFNLIIKQGRWVNGVFFDLKYLNLAKIGQFVPKHEEPEKFKKQLKLAFSVGLKVSKKAVERNRLKRQMREVARLLLKSDRLQPGYYAMFTAKKSALGKNYAEIRQEIELLLFKAKVLDNTNGLEVHQFRKF